MCRHRAGRFRLAGSCRVCACLRRRYLVRVVRVPGMCAQACSVGLLVKLCLHAAAGHRVRAVRCRGCVEGQFVLLAVPLGALRCCDVLRGIGLVVVEVALYGARLGLGGSRCVCAYHLCGIVSCLRNNCAASSVEARHAAARDGLRTVAPILRVVGVLALACSCSAHGPALSCFCVCLHALCAALCKLRAFLRVRGRRLGVRLRSLCRSLGCLRRLLVLACACSGCSCCRLAADCLISCRFRSRLRGCRISSRFCRCRAVCRDGCLAFLGVRLRRLCCRLRLCRIAGRRLCACLRRAGVRGRLRRLRGVRCRGLLRVLRLCGGLLRRVGCPGSCLLGSSCRCRLRAGGCCCRLRSACVGLSARCCRLRGCLRRFCRCLGRLRL